MNTSPGAWPAARTPCVVMCGGKSSRFAAAGAHKSMVSVQGAPLLGHVLEYWRAFADDFIFVVKNGKESVIEFVRETQIKARFAEPDSLRGIADGLRYVEPLIKSPFIVVLGDCFCRGAFEFPDRFEYGIGVQRNAMRARIRRNYGVVVEEGRVVSVEEKPLEVRNDLCGMGFYFFQPDVFRYIPRTAPSPRTNQIEITDVLQTMVDAGVDLRAVMFDGTYVNVNTPEDLAEVVASVGRGGAPPPP